MSEGNEIKKLVSDMREMIQNDKPPEEEKTNETSCVGFLKVLDDTSC